MCEVVVVADDDNCVPPGLGHGGDHDRRESRLFIGAICGVTRRNALPFGWCEAEYDISVRQNGNIRVSDPSYAAGNVSISGVVRFNSEVIVHGLLPNCLHLITISGNNSYIPGTRSMKTASL